ncbi:MAG: hypothetical protein ABIS86_17510 [Streptosporangiaceae bacterium]
MATSGGTTGAGTAGAGTGDIRYTASGTVLENHEHGPQFCGAVAQTLPPQCSGVDVMGWNWQEVEHEARGQVKWGVYTVVGTWDGARLTLTERPEPPRWAAPAQEVSVYASPCPPPAGGWKPVDERKATWEALEAAVLVARESARYAGTWVDGGYLEHVGGEPDDPRRLVLNVAFTGDLQENEQRIREVWGGALCVSSARHTEADLLWITETVTADIPGGVSSSGVDTVANQVVVTVYFATEDLQQDLDARYGAGVVRAEGIFNPA